MKRSLAIDKIGTDKSKTCVAYVYFDYKNMEAQTGDYVVRTLLKQLLLPLDSIPRELEAAYYEYRSRLTVPDQIFFVRQLLSTAAAFSSTYIILDALDECSTQTLDNVVSLVRQCQDAGMNVLCTFRPTLMDIAARLNTSTIHSISAHNEDIRNYLSIRLNKEWPHNLRFIPQIIERLAAGAEGQFVPPIFLLADQE
jgi:hypothetical protein